MLLDRAVQEEWSLEQTKQQVKSLQPAKATNQEMIKLSNRLSRIARQAKSRRLSAAARKDLISRIEKAEKLLGEE